MIRKHVIPKGAVEIDNQGTDASIWYYTMSQGSPALIAFHGKANKPDLHYRFRSEQDRNKQADAFIEARRAHAIAKAKRKAEAAKPNTMKIGDILYSTWGYDQTNVEFFSVTRVTARTVDLQPIGSKTVKDLGWESRAVIADPTSLIGEPLLRRRVGAHGGVKIRSCGAYAWAWHGRPITETSYA